MIILQFRGMNKYLYIIEYQIIMRQLLDNSESQARERNRFKVYSGIVRAQIL
jgi:hypothetical protein